MNEESSGLWGKWRTMPHLNQSMGSLTLLNTGSMIIVLEFLKISKSFLSTVFELSLVLKESLKNCDFIVPLKYLHTLYKWASIH